MTAAVWTHPRRWRAFADAVAVALGVNVWVSLVLLPGFFVGAWHSGAAIALASLSLIVLGVGVARRSELVLLLGYPATLLMPIAVAPDLAQVHVYGPVRLGIVALGLVGYLLGASVFTSFREAPPPESTRMLSSARMPTPERWRRRLRVYRGLVALSIVFPLVLLYTINFDAASQEFLRQKYPGRVAALTLVMNVAAIGVWLLVYHRFFLGILSPHRTGDRDLRTELSRIKRETRVGRPRPSFYVGVAVALGFMLLLLVTRYL